MMMRYMVLVCIHPFKYVFDGLRNGLFFLTRMSPSVVSYIAMDGLVVKLIFSHSSWDVFLQAHPS